MPFAFAFLRIFASSFGGERTIVCGLPFGFFSVIARYHYHYQKCQLQSTHVEHHAQSGLLTNQTTQQNRRTRHYYRLAVIAFVSAIVVFRHRHTPIEFRSLKPLENARPHGEDAGDQY